MGYELTPPLPNSKPGFMTYHYLLEGGEYVGFVEVRYLAEGEAELFGDAVGVKEVGAPFAVHAYWDSDKGARPLPRWTELKGLARYLRERFPGVRPDLIHVLEVRDERIRYVASARDLLG